MTQTLRRTRLLMVAWLLAGCAGVFTPVEEPRVSIVSVKVLPASGIEQRIEVGLRVMNPNSFTLAARGLVVNVGFNDLQLLRGVAADPPPVPAYSEAEMTVVLSASLLNGIRLVSRLMERPGEPLQYRLEARLDMGAPLWRSITVLDQGEISGRHPVSASPETP
jgi:LEA14-like dessication related protein